MFSYRTSEEKVLYQCYSRKKIVLKVREKKRKERESTLLLIMSEKLNYSDEQDIKTSDSKALFWRPRYA